MRKLTKIEWKQLWQVWRSLDKYDRINYLCFFDDYTVERAGYDRNATNSLLVKSLKLKIGIEQSQLEAA